MEAALFVIVALVVGLGLGWFLGGRPVAEMRQRFLARDGEARELDEKFRRAITELAGASERAMRADGLASELSEAQARNAVLQGQLATAATRADSAERLAAELPDLRASREVLAAELATLKANAANFDEKQRLLMEAQEALKKEFAVAGAKVLEGAQQAFLQRAQERFAVSEEKSAQQIKALLAPVGERLKSYEDHVSSLEAKRVDAFGQLTGLIEGMRVGQEQVRAEAARLGNSLRNAPKARGRWGEQQLKNVLEQCGLSEHTDFVTEHSIETEEGRLRPDAIVNIPGQKKLVIDAKVSLNAYQEAFEAQDDLVRDSALAQHVASMRNHVQTLGAKSYQSQFEDAPDYVVMFVPGEHFVAAALEKDPELWDFAFRNRVLLATPTNLVAIARTVAQVWRQDGLAREAREIGRMGGELYDRLAVAAEHMKRVGSGLSSAVDNYNKFVGSFERNVLSAGRRLRDKHIEIGKREIEEVPLVESSPRYAESAATEPAVPLLVETEQE
ncbi:DNA recombination protein RmuC [Novosphingobium sp. JCM 18896]|uniref:DNA recombination protein RmuC n=1 Tax=Novosphingobium sp. JCM 18896 TaxID=2989731 RepID=UPI0022229456|nr:DNA recombination protein RmuC [Novosphingobium sp. JCM 18896]MCW1427885.1 DNA recombination protein RmuC [Novosphingobium sp. JCM 18896]